MRRRVVQNPQIMHFVGEDGYYLCNKAVTPTESKIAATEGRVTCKNCKRRK